MEQSLAGQAAIVTGGGRGIGRATAIRLARAGAAVAVISRTASELTATVAAIAASGGRALAVPGDVADEAFVGSAFASIERELGLPTILVNNAGAVRTGHIVDLALADFELVLRTNLTGAFLFSRALLRRLATAGRPGSIVNLSSLGGLANTQKFPGLAAYVAAKFGVVGLTEALAVEGRPLGVRCNCVAPGAVDTQMLREAAPFLKTSTTPADVAEILYFLCDATKSGKLSGATLPIHSNEN